MQIVTANEMYAIDRCTMEKVKLPGVALMESAGRAAAAEIVKRVDRNDRIAVLAGTGNNGGDGFVIARSLLAGGYDVTLWVLAPEEKLKGDAGLHRDIFAASGYRARYAEQEGFDVLLAELPAFDVYIDAIFGIGIKGEVRPPYREAIAAVNGMEGRKIAIDIPSGLEADSSDYPDAVFKADVTITLQCPKTGAFLYPGREAYGELVTVDIGIPPAVIEKETGNRQLWEEPDVIASMPRRKADSHKGSHGRGLVIGGSRMMKGAPAMAALAAMRSGAGLLSAAVPESAADVVATHAMEAMYRPLPEKDGFIDSLHGVDIDEFDALAAGPGFGRHEKGTEVIEYLLKAVKVPLVLDADALYHAAFLKDALKQRQEPVILTPHPGEMAHLTGMPIAEIQSSRFRLSREFAVEFGAFLVLKGPHTIVTAPDGRQWVNTTGNPALAKGGSGDVLTGMILAFLMQHNVIQPALSNAVFLHGRAADYLTKAGHTSMDVLAGDLVDALPAAFSTVAN